MTRQRDPQTRLSQLREVLSGARTLLIVMQDNPDPDALAAAAALRALANHLYGIRCSLAASGWVGRAENVALLEYIDLNIRPLAGLELDRFDRLAMVDAQPGGNVALDASLRFDIVIDHHPVRNESRAARLTDIRKHYGATSSILYEYLACEGVEISTQLATALVYGIRSDTQDLGREASKADIDAYLALFPRANIRALAGIIRPPLPRPFFVELHRAFEDSMLYGDRVISNLGEVRSQEIVAESADLFLRAEGVQWVMCLGRVGDWIHLSFRQCADSPKAEEIAKEVAKGLGKAGGHQTLAGAQIPLEASVEKNDDCRRSIFDELKKRFLKATGSSKMKGEPFCRQ